MKNQDMTNSQLTNRLREIVGEDGAIEWNTKMYQDTKYWENQQHFVEQLRKDAQAIEQELESRKGKAK